MPERKPRQSRAPELRLLKNRLRHRIRRPSPPSNCADPGPATAPRGPVSHSAQQGAWGGRCARHLSGSFPSPGGWDQGSGSGFSGGEEGAGSSLLGYGCGWLAAAGESVPLPRASAEVAECRGSKLLPGCKAACNPARPGPPQGPSTVAAPARCPLRHVHASAQAVTPFPVFLHSTAVPASTARPPRTTPARAGASEAGG